MRGAASAGLRMRIARRAVLDSMAAVCVWNRTTITTKKMPLYCTVKKETVCDGCSTSSVVMMRCGGVPKVLME